MPLVTERQAVVDLFDAAASRGWVIPAMGVENLTTVEAVLSAGQDYGDRIGQPDLPLLLAITNRYPSRSQSANYTHTRRWDIGLRLLMADIGVLSAPGSPFEKLNVMVHLDHAMHDLDQDLFGWDLSAFSSIMFDASSLPFEQNIESTARFVERHGKHIVIEGACEEIVEASGTERGGLTSPERAEQYFYATGCDLIVANLGTEHRASTKDLQYHGDLARAIRERIGPRICLHGASSVPEEQLAHLFEDGVCKVNVWTALERDSSPALLDGMIRNAAKISGPLAAEQLYHQGLLGPKTDLTSPPMLSHFTTVWRQTIIFEQMKRIAGRYLELWYR